MSDDLVTDISNKNVMLTVHLIVAISLVASSQYTIVLMQHSKAVVAATHTANVTRVVY